MLRMKRFTTPLMATLAAEKHCTCCCGNTNNNNNNRSFLSSAELAARSPSLTTTTAAASAIIATQRRYLKAHDVREYKPLGMPIEMKYYQRFTTHPGRQSGIQFLSHYSDHRRWNVRGNYIDYLNWGREQGQAHLPHRHQRVAFDFHDTVHPSRAVKGSGGKGSFVGQDPSTPLARGQHPDLSAAFDPNAPVFGEPTHMNRIWTEMRADDRIHVPYHRKSPIKAVGLDGRLLGHSFTGDRDEDFLGALPSTNGSHRSFFPTEDREFDFTGVVPGRVPGLNAPYLGEPDRQHMQAMSMPLTLGNTITGNDGRFSKTLYMNMPTRDNALSAGFAKDLNEQIDMAVNGVHSKLVVLKAAQSGVTDRFSAGMDVEQYSYDMALAEKYDAEARDLENRLAEVAAVAGSSAAPSLTATQKSRMEAKANELRSLAARHRMRVDDALRAQTGLVWRTFTAPRPLMTFINGKCHNTACGLALFAKFPALRDSTEFIVDGPNFGLSSFAGGATHLLARPETTGKMPGLAEYTLLTGNALYAGDALRLGWSELFTTFEDMDYHIKDWFDASEHMHNDAVAWQLGHLLDSCFKMKEHHSTAMERAAITPIRAKWVEDAFADQKSVESIIATLSQMERLPTGPTPRDAAAAGNTFDIAGVTPYSLFNVDDAIAKLTKNNLHFALAPWDITPPASNDAQSFADAPINSYEDGAEVENAKSHFASVFTNYVFERDSKGREVAVLSAKDRLRMRAWRKQRYEEYNDYVTMMNRPVKRHVFVRVEGCDGKLVDFEHFFDRKTLEDAASASAAATAASTNSESSYVQNTSFNDCMIRDVLRKVAEKMGYDPTRPLELGWYLPTLDTARIRTDEELVKVLQTDPGFEAPTEFGPTAHSPIYFIVKRGTLHMSEWAYATKHQLLLSSPFALKANFELLGEVRTGGAQQKGTSSSSSSAEEKTELEVAESSIMTLSDTLATEFRYASRLVKRRDFYAVGYNATKTMAQWEANEDEQATCLHLSDAPTARPKVTFDDVFERDVVIDGHKFMLRPKWYPRTLEDVSETEVAALREPLDFERDGGLTEIHVPTYTNKCDRVAASINDIGGFEVVPGLGELSSATGSDKKKGGEGAQQQLTNAAAALLPASAFKVAPLVSDAHVPTNVNFYIMARHPWTDQPNSWRQDTFTDASLEYMTAQYKDALLELKGANNNNNNSDGSSSNNNNTNNRGGNNRRGNNNNNNNNYSGEASLAAVERMPTNYWPSREEVDGSGAFAAEEEALLKDRLYNAVNAATAKVEQWATTLRHAASTKSTEYRVEITSQQERFGDDNYYRWFVRPGEHPNPSGLLRNGKAVVSPSSSQSASDATLDPETLMASFEDSEAYVGDFVDTSTAAVEAPVVE